MRIFARNFRTAAVLAAVAIASSAAAGPPLICHPFVTEAEAPLLPWAQGKNWRLPDPSYEVAGLVEDTLALLSADAPILARMENMRRAAIYAESAPGAAAALLRAVHERTESKPADARAAAIELFDLGYLVETYRQLGLVYEHGMLPAKEHAVPFVPTDLEHLDGYELLQRALALAPEAKAEIHFAASLMTREPLTAALRSRAAAAAPAASLLAQNLAIFGH
jgi:hypothetical protein